MAPSETKDQPALTDIRTDCARYIGYKPCGKAEDCRGCPDFRPLGPRVLIVKLGALGDVLRTTPLLRGLKEQLPGLEITWLTSPAAAGLLEGNPLIDRLWVTGSEALSRLMVEGFDRVICLDKEPEAAAAASLAAAPGKFGFGLTDQGRLTVFNQAAVENLRLGLSDELKFRRNAKTYQQLIFEASELTWRPEYDYLLVMPEEDRTWAKEFLAERLKPGGGPVIAFNLGGGKVFAAKRWKLDYFLALRRLIEDRWAGTAAVLAIGGPEEEGRLERLKAAPGPEIIDTGCHNSYSRLAALLERCDIMVTGDSLAMHAALAVGTPCLVLIGSTAPAEIELYGRGEKMISERPCAPCYRRLCTQERDCMNDFKPEAVLKRLEALLA